MQESTGKTALIRRDGGALLEQILDSPQMAELVPTLAARGAARRHRALRPRGMRRAAGAGDARPGRARPRSGSLAPVRGRPRRAVRRRSVRRLARGAGRPGRRRGGADRRRARRRPRRRRPCAACPHLRHRHARGLRHHGRHGDPRGDRAGRRSRLRHRRSPAHPPPGGCLGRHRGRAGRARRLAPRGVRAADARLLGACRTRDPRSMGSTTCSPNADQAMFELADAREQRREAHGFATPASARGRSSTARGAPRAMRRQCRSASPRLRIHGHRAADPATRASRSSPGSPTC